MQSVSDPQRHSSTLFLVAPILLFGVIYAATLRDGHDWGGDFAMYIQHARNLAEGAPYDRSGYIVNPAVPDLGPRTYPPVFPLLLAPVYALFGLNLTAMKLELVFLFMLFLGVLVLWLRRDLPPGLLLALVASIALNPFFWDFKDRVMSEIPFVLFAYSALALIERFNDTGAPRRPTAGAGLAAGLLVYLACGTRSIGIALVLCMILHDVLRWRRLSSLTITALIVFLPCLAAQTLFLHSDADYASNVRISAASAIENAVMYGRSLSLLFDNGYLRIGRHAVFLAVTALSLFGWFGRLRECRSIRELFPPVYMVLVIAWPSRSDRFLIPVIPLYFFYVLDGIRRLVALRPRIGRRAAWLLAMSVLVVYASNYTTKTLDPLDEGVGRMESRQLFEFVRSSTKESDVLVFRKPRVLALFTGRRATVYHRAASDEELRAFLVRVGVRYLITGPGDPDHWMQFVQRQAERLDLVFSNRDFKVYAFDAGAGSARLRLTRP